MGGEMNHCLQRLGFECHFQSQSHQLQSLPPAESAIALDVSDVESRNEIAGGVTAANLPHFLRKWRRSWLVLDSSSVALVVLSFLLSPDIKAPLG